MRALSIFVVLLLAGTALARNSPAAYDKKMGETHSGAAAGVVQPAAAGRQGKEQKIGETCQAGCDWWMMVAATNYARVAYASSMQFNYDHMHTELPDTVCMAQFFCLCCQVAWMLMWLCPPSSTQVLCC
jgi:hypothetical protein